MTCIIATRSLLIGDRRVSDDDGQRHDPITKVFAGPWLLAGGAGTAECIHALREGVKTAGQPSDLTECLDEASEGVALYKGGIWYVTSERARRVTKPFFTIGSGGRCAEDFLAGAGKLDLRALKAAMRYVATRRTDCGDGIRIVGS